MNRLLRDYLVRQVPLAPGVLLPETASVKEAVEAMRQAKAGCVIARKNDVLTGIFTERDVLYKVVGENVDWTSPFLRFATPSVVTMEYGEPLRKALYLMRKEGFRQIPIFDGKELKGVLTIRNVIRLLAEHFPQEVMNLPPRIHGEATAERDGG